jgi:selenide,water dikinase
VFRLPDGTLLVQTVDFFTPVVDDPYDWGRIGASNALSDVYAMGGTPLTALQLVGWPRGVIDFEVLGRVLEGGADVMAAAGCTIVGGHSIDDGEPKYGFAVTGIVDENALITNAGGRPGDRLILTKPLGSGIVTTAIKAGSASAEIAEETVEVMAGLNDVAARVVRGRAHAGTDVTGYGLLGHLHEIAVASGLSAVVGASDVPLLSGVVELAEAGVYPGGSGRNLDSLTPYLAVVDVDEVMIRVLADAQTSGGLLLAVAAADVAEVLADLHEAGVAAVDIGRLVAGDPGKIEVRR